MALEIGNLLYGRYRIESVLGRGGMGAVYQALDENLGIQVAVKDNFFTNEESARQFRREATILATLRHPNLPRVTDHFVIAGQGQYLVMDFIAGEDLQSKIENGGLSDERLVVEWARQICDALQYLHNHHPSVLHRDVKPGNIRLTPDGRVVLVDFGLVRLMGGKATATAAKATTEGYSPPEQYGYSSTDTRTDIYGLAATLYAILTGSQPEDGLKRALARETLTPVRTRNPKVSPGAAAAIEKALEILPENRYQTIGEFQKALTLSLPPDVPTQDDSAPPEKPGGISRTPQRFGRFPLGWILTIGSLALLIVAGVLIFALIGTQHLASLWSSSAPTPTKTHTALPLVTTNTSVPTVLPTVLSTPIGNSDTLAFVSDRSGIPQIYSMDIDGKNLLQITNLSEGACQPDWSPNGMQLIFVSPCASIDGPYKKASIFRIDADGSGQTSLTKMPGGDYFPAWSPDGKLIAMTSLQDSRQHIYVMDSNGDNRVSISPTGAVDYQPRWSSDGKRIVFISEPGDRSVVFIENIDPVNLHRIEFSTVTDPAMSPDWSVDNYILYVLRSRGQLVFYNVDQRFTQNELTPAGQGTTVARFSPDGKWILFDKVDKNNRDIYLLPIVGEKIPRRITSDLSIETDPAWRPIHAGS
jgi:serine/threonine protein kinase